MDKPDPAEVRWERFVAELRADAAAERADWGEIDEETLALYASGACPDGERARVEAAASRYPLVRDLVEDFRRRAPVAAVNLTDAFHPPTLATGSNRGPAARVRPAGASTGPGPGQEGPAAPGHLTAELRGPGPGDPGESDRVPGAAALRGLGLEIVGVAGVGRGGEVYRAYDGRRGRLVALKALPVISPQRLSVFKQRFRNLAGFTHTNVVELYELVTNGRRWWFTMELVNGTDLLTYVRGLPGVGLDPVRLRDAFRQLAGGLAAFHGGGFLHREIDPTHVLVTGPGRVVIVGLGTAAGLGDEDTPRYQEGRAVGSVAYEAPERAEGGAVTAAGDWYSVGAVLYEALTGRRPGTEGSLGVLVTGARPGAPAPRPPAPGPPEDLEALCAELLRRDPALRPSQDEVLRRLGAT